MAAKAGRLQIQLALDVQELRRDLDATNAALKRAAGSWQTSLKGFASGMSQVFSGQALLDAVKQFGAAVKATIDDMGDIADGAAKLGDSAEMFQGLRAAAEQCGVAIDDVSGASNKLQLQLGKIQSGGGKEANDALAKLHLTLGDLKGLSPGDAFIKAGGRAGRRRGQVPTSRHWRGAVRQVVGQP
jgi:hypothetical protein